MKVSVSVPATLANMGSGFDSLGIAVGLRNTVTIEESDVFSIAETGMKIDGEDLLSKTIADFLKRKGAPRSVRITKNTRIPAGKGLGSSAAAIVSGLGAAMKFTGDFDLDTLFGAASFIEGHPDNVAPAVYGGMTVSAKVGDAFRAMRIGVPFGTVTVLVPPFRTSTRMARSVMPEKIPLSDAVFNLQRLAMMLAGFSKGLTVKEGFEDRIHQPVRLPIFPEVRDLFEEVRKKADAPVFLCGSGPAIGVIGEFSIGLPCGWERMTLGVAEEGLRFEI